MQNTIRKVNNTYWKGALLSLNCSFKRVHGQPELIRGIWFDGTWLNGYWRAWGLKKGSYLEVDIACYWLSGQWEKGSICYIYKWRYCDSKLSPKALFRPKTTLSLNYANYQ